MACCSVGDPFETRTWAIESAQGMGYLLAQQLVAAGEHVLDVPATLASPCCGVEFGPVDEERSQRARSVAVAALHASSLVEVRPETTPRCCRLLGQAPPRSGRWRNKLCCRLHVMVAELVPGGISKEVVVTQALRSWRRSSQRRPRLVSGTGWRSSSSPRSTTSTIGCASQRPVDDAVRAWGRPSPTLRHRHGRRRDAHRLQRRSAALATPPASRLHRHRAVEFSSGGRVVHPVPCAEPAPQPRPAHRSSHPDPHRNSPGRGYYDRNLARGKTPREAIRALKRAVRCRVAPPRQRRRERSSTERSGPGRDPRGDSEVSAAGSNPEHRASTESHHPTRHHR